ncbi:MAG: 4-hydroxy-3-methylbut-2-enyl diphosphate reductase [Bacteroidales bacterium]|nr:4-hydroxy-3-methylbut-2-enyl diphosphate reductase [Bacteroidales bacterium]
MTVEIDRNSGFCGGVIRAIDGAEKFLAEGGPLYSLGAIVHNESELARLRAKGLVTVSLDDISSPSPESLSGDASRRTLLIRAHGEPPETYRIAKERGWKVVDFTCPVVLKIQKSIREARERNAPDGQIVIFGKIGHAEVLGLVGQVGGDATVVENLAQLKEAIASGTIDLGRHVDIFSQTTKSPVEYEEICSYLSSRIADKALLSIHNTICRQVASRHKELAEFARSHDVVVFVSGKESSNGRVLSELCRSVNPRTYKVGSASELDSSWFRPEDNVGVCGATSTPKWLLEEVAVQIKNLH